ncbi:MULTISPECIES: carboxymuconolactone decarboxylase family protein [Pacificibacter]|uniref:carboxymuconolactone decarboxylase family protein n=1 Tax=Pacificibacter TaxID=1042323 RepID=UPI001C08DC2D|nr:MULTISPECIES: carboxymuconolactone decarboxylase family protein [Pacificibacter]MBU2935736.1 carboxymuconolactone decarboxylase family protein [Pacificibacter marinus]MDO6614232.1 carboxymuconolactone decarboxylase family protein [Pacificibacter sp. 1_MG-2023]
MTTVSPVSDAYTKGKAFTEATNPGMEDALAKRYDPVLPGLARDLVELNGRIYPRGVLDEKTRELLTISALTALGGQTKPQLKIHVAAARKLGLTQQEISEAIYQMSLYGGMPAMFNALNAAMEVFDTEVEAS